MSNVKFEDDYLGREERDYTFPEWNKIEEKFISLILKSPSGPIKIQVSKFVLNNLLYFFKVLRSSFCK